MKFDSETCYFAGQLPEFGAIFMCNTATKIECFERKLVGLPSGQTNFVKHVKTGMILFLFEFERRELHGVFRACSDGAINIIPHAFKSSGKQFPAQVRFTPIWHCSPLPEREFRDAIRENYFSSNKFNFGLSEKQVRELLKLFSMRKLKDKHLDRHFSQSKVAKQIGYAVNETRNAVGDSSFLTVHDEKDEESANVNLGLISSKRYKDYVNSYLRAFDADICASSSVGYKHKAETDFGMLFSNKQFGNPQGRLGRSVDNVQLLTSKEIGNEHNVNVDPRLGITDYFGNSSSIGGSMPNQAITAMIPGENEWNEHNALKPRILPEYPDFLRLNPPLYSSKYMPEENSAINDHIQQSSAMHRSMAPQNLDVSHSISHRDTGDVNTLHYCPDFPAINSMYSSPLVLLKSLPECSIRNSIFPHFEDQTLSPNLEAESTRRCPYLNSNASDNVPFSCSSLDVSPYSKSMYSVREKKRESVFSRLALPQDLSEQGVGHVECGADSSLDEVMAMLHQNHYDWVKAKSFKKLIRIQNDIVDVRKEKQVTLNSKQPKANLPKISKQVERQYISSNEENVIQKTEQMPLVDFKRRSDVRKLGGNVNSNMCNESVQNNGFSEGQRKKRKLIRPNFIVNESSNAVMVVNKNERSNKSEIFDTQKSVDNEQNLHTGVEENVDVEKISYYDREENVQSYSLSFRNAAEERKEEVQIAHIQGVPVSTFWEGESHKVKAGSPLKNCEDERLPQNPTDTSCSIFQESFLELNTEKLEIVANDGSHHNGGSNKSLQDVESVDKTCPVSDDRNGSNSIQHNPELEKSSEVFENGGAIFNNLQRSVAGNCIPCIEAVRCGNMQELSQGTCKGNVEQLAATAGRDCKMNVDKSIRNGTNLPFSCGESITSLAEFCSCNQNLASREELVDAGLSSDGNDAGTQSMEFIAV